MLAIRLSLQIFLHITKFDSEGFSRLLFKGVIYFVIFKEIVSLIRHACCGVGGRFTEDQISPKKLQV